MPLGVNITPCLNGRVNFAPITGAPSCILDVQHNPRAQPQGFQAHFKQLTGIQSSDIRRLVNAIKQKTCIACALILIEVPGNALGVQKIKRAAQVVFRSPRPGNYRPRPFDPDAAAASKAQTQTQHKKH